jgi:hypothetical protein
MTDAEKWRRLGDGLMIDADCLEMVGKYDAAKERYKAANEAYAKARECRKQAANSGTL